jgi:hypothetical protein
MGVSKTYALQNRGSLVEGKTSPFLAERIRRQRQQEETVSRRYRRLVAIRQRAS